MGRRLDWSGSDLIALHNRKDTDRILSRPRKRRISLRRRRFTCRSPYLDLLFRTNILLRRRVYTGICEEVWFVESGELGQLSILMKPNRSNNFINDYIKTHLFCYVDTVPLTIQLLFLNRVCYL